MSDANVKPTPWAMVALAILSGAWLIIGSQGNAAQSLGAELVILAALVATAAGTVLVSLLRFGCLTSWCLPVLGALLWQAGELHAAIAFARRVGSNELVNRLDDPVNRFLAQPLAPVINAISWAFVATLAVSAGVAFLYLVYRTIRSRMPWQGWVLLTLVMASSLLLDFLARHSSYWSLADALIAYIVFWLPLLLVPVVIGVPISKRDGLLAGVLALTCVPTWMSVFGYPGGEAIMQLSKLLGWAGGGQSGQVPLVLLRLLLLAFFVLIPIGLLRARTVRMQIVWLVLVPLLTLVGMAIAPALAALGTQNVYSLTDWLVSGLSVVQLLLPLAIAATVYRPHRDEEPVAGVE